MTNSRHPALRSRAAVPIGKLAAALAAYEGAKQMIESVQRLYNDKVIYTVTVNSDDALYDEALLWISESLSDDKQRALAVKTSNPRTVYEGDEAEPAKTRMKVTFNDSSPKTFQVEGCRISARVSRPESGESSRRSTHSIIFTAHTKSGQKALIAALDKLNTQRTHREPVLRIVNQWSHWERRSDLPLRSLESVVLPAVQKSDIVNDLRSFLEDEDKYVDLALPWHRGYLLHGEPGTGKTSLVKALANEFKLDLWYVSLNDLKEDASLIALLGEVSPRSILLIEDVDTLQVTRDRSAGKDTSDAAPTKISLSSLLNALDGVATPHGLITIMTTNHFEKLDPALTRAGRMDRIEYLTYPTLLEVEGLYQRFYNKPLGLQKSDLHMKVQASPAELSEALKRNLHDPQGGKAALLELIKVATREDAAA